MFLKLLISQQKLITKRYYCSNYLQTGADKFDNQIGQFNLYVFTFMNKIICIGIAE